MFDTPRLTGFKRFSCFALLLIFIAGLSAESAEEIIQKMDSLQTFDSVRVEGSMISEDRFGERKSDYISWSRGGQDFLIEFTNVEERGQKILRVEDAIFLFYPEAEDIIPLHGAALKQSLFGDISYQDISEGQHTLRQYSVKIIGEENLEGLPHWLIEMNAISRHVPYPKQIIKVGKADYIMREASYYSRSNRLLKIMRVEKIEVLADGRSIVVAMTLEDQIRHQSRTRMLITDIQIDPPLEDNLFSLRSLY